MKIIVDYLDVGDYVLGIGANVGIYSLLLSTCLAIEESTEAFEPGEITHSFLWDNILINGIKNIEVHGLDCTDKNGEIWFHQTSDICTIRVSATNVESADETLSSVRIEDHLPIWN